LEEKGSGFTKDFLGVSALVGGLGRGDYTYPFAGFGRAKGGCPRRGVVLDAPDGREIGKVLTCTTDVAVGRHEGRIYSVASPDRPEGFNPRGLSGGFVKVGVAPGRGTESDFAGPSAENRVMVEDDIRPNRTARRPMKSMLIS
jgi:aminomethyltransferase